MKATVNEIITGVFSALLVGGFSFVLAIAFLYLISPYITVVDVNSLRWPAILIALLGAIWGYRANQTYHRRKQMPSDGE